MNDEYKCAGCHVTFTCIAGARSLAPHVRFYDRWSCMLGDAAPSFCGVCTQDRQRPRLVALATAATNGPSGKLTPGS